MTPCSLQMTTSLFEIGAYILSELYEIRQSTVVPRHHRRKQFADTVMAE